MSGALSDLPEVPVGSEFSLRCSVRNAGAMTEMRWLKRLEQEVKAAPAAKDVVKLDDGRLYKVGRNTEIISTYVQVTGVS